MPDPDDADQPCPTSACGGRLTRKGAATRARIVATAAVLFHEHGVAGTSLDDVCAAAGVGRSQLYHYFADKADLVQGVIDHDAEHLTESQHRLLERVDSIDALRDWRDAMVQATVASGFSGCRLGSLAGELARADDPTRRRIAAAFDRWESGIRSGLEAMQAQRELPEDVDVDRLAVALLAAVEGGTLLSQTRRSAEPLAAALDAVIDLIAASRPPRGRAGRR
jgi:AcrR family transcriptional regulator